VGIRFRKAGKIYDFAKGNLALEIGDTVIVETVRGLEYGCVARPPRQVEEKNLPQPLKEVLRRADEDDKAIQDENCRKEAEAFKICLRKIEAHNLPMKLVNVEYTFDGNKIIFSFTAEGRVDFRELVRDLASVFRTRIELRQIGVRDEAKIIGGLSTCGRELCCATFLEDFEPVSIRMAKEQNISLNPSKISGVCGRLMCCLKYESGCYECKRSGKNNAFLKELDAAAEPEDLHKLLDEAED
jgi:cell fate regulator YaaT (PSP1 superfamily)